jgi:hypothetical protein
MQFKKSKYHTPPPYFHPPQPKPPGTNDPDCDTFVFLISYTNQQKQNPGSLPAKDLFNSSWFRQCRRYNESQNRNYYIICGKHGLIHPETLMTTYDYSISNLNLKERQQWGKQVVDDLVSVEKLLPGDIVTVFSSEMYFAALLDAFNDLDIYSEQPLCSMNMGQQLRWFRDRVGYENPQHDPTRKKRAYKKRVENF